MRAREREKEEGTLFVWDLTVHHVDILVKLRKAQDLMILLVDQGAQGPAVVVVAAVVDARFGIMLSGGKKPKCLSLA